MKSYISTFEFNAIKEFLDIKREQLTSPWLGYPTEMEDNNGVVLYLTQEEIDKRLDVVDLLERDLHQMKVESDLYRSGKFNFALSGRF